MNETVLGIKLFDNWSFPISIPKEPIAVPGPEFPPHYYMQFTLPLSELIALDEIPVFQLEFKYLDALTASEHRKRNGDKPAVYWTWRILNAIGIYDEQLAKAVWEYFRWHDGNGDRKRFASW